MNEIWNKIYISVNVCISFEQGYTFKATFIFIHFSSFAPCKLHNAHIVSINIISWLIWNKKVFYSLFLNLNPIPVLVIVPVCVCVCV